jgi:hypothetical protein
MKGKNLLAIAARPIAGKLYISIDQKGLSAKTMSKANDLAISHTASRLDRFLFVRNSVYVIE